MLQHKILIRRRLLLGVHKNWVQCRKKFQIAKHNVKELNSTILPMNFQIYISLILRYIAISWIRVQSKAIYNVSLRWVHCAQTINYSALSRLPVQRSERLRAQYVLRGERHIRCTTQQLAIYYLTSQLPLFGCWKIWTKESSRKEKNPIARTVQSNTLYTYFY